MGILSKDFWPLTNTPDYLWAHLRNRRLLVSERRKMRWNQCCIKKSQKLLSSQAHCKPHKKYYITPHWNWMNGYWNWNPLFCARCMTSHFCDFFFTNNFLWLTVFFSFLTQATFFWCSKHYRSTIAYMCPKPRWCSGVLKHWYGSFDTRCRK